MGQIISVTGTVVGDSAIYDADRSISGQDGEAYESLEAAEAESSFPAQLAARVFDADSAVTRVFAGSNGIVVQRSGGWSDSDLEKIRSIIENFFVFYR